MPLTRIVTAVAALGAAVVVAGPAAGSASRTVVVSYTGSDSVNGVSVGGLSGQGSSIGEVTVPTRRSDRAVAVSLGDASGLPVAVEVQQGEAGDAGSVSLGLVCGSGRVHLILPGAPLHLYPVVASCPAGPSVPTQGTATLRF